VWNENSKDGKGHSEQGEVCFSRVALRISSDAGDAVGFARTAIFGTITGTVTDQTGAAVAAATVVVTNVGTNATTSAETSEQGHYTFAQLPVGIYEIRVKQPSFKESITKGIEVHTSTDTEVNVALQLGAANETMTVEAADVQVQTTTAVVGEVVAGTQVRELPLNGENFMGLVTLSPGVSTSNDFDGRARDSLAAATFL